jgi:hypothetical protein
VDLSDAHKHIHTHACAHTLQEGYENLCCLPCVQTRDTAHGTNCICRVPKRKLEEVPNCMHFTSVV